MEVLDLRTEEEFEQAHRDFGGSSHAAALFDRGYSGLSSRWSLFMHFKGKLDHQADLEENQRVRIGKATEDIHAHEEKLSGSVLEADEVGVGQLFISGDHHVSGSFCR